LSAERGVGIGVGRLTLEVFFFKRIAIKPLKHPTRTNYFTFENPLFWVNFNGRFGKAIQCQKETDSLDGVLTASTKG